MKAKKKASRTWRRWALLPRGFASIKEVALNDGQIDLVATRDGARMCLQPGEGWRIVRVDITESEASR